MMKKLIALLLCIFMLVACCGCSLTDYFSDDFDDRDSSFTTSRLNQYEQYNIALLEKF